MLEMGATTRECRTRLLGVLVILGAALLYYSAFVWTSGERYEGVLYFTLFDDAMISMTYARNLADDLPGDFRTG